MNDAIFDPDVVLVAPIQVDALVLDRPTAVVGADMDFASMPWSDGSHDHNVNIPNLAAYANSEPFTEGSLLLSPGTHLHWSLPDALTRGSTEPRDWAPHPVNDIYFPPAPNRWLVRRRGGGERAWIVESDYVWPLAETTLATDRTDRSAITFPAVNPAPGTPPFVRIGRQFPADAPLAPGEYLPDRGAVLTCAGFGDPAFGALYANCRTVFGMRDEAPATGRVEYEVIGWYGHRPGGGLPKEPLACFATWSSRCKAVELRSRLNAEEVEKKPLETPLEPEERLRAVALFLRDAFGWTVNGSAPLPAQMICYGRVTIDAAKADEPAVQDGQVDAIGLGHTGAEALGALLADALSGKDRNRRNAVERRLESLRLQPLLRDDPADLVPRFDEVRHRAQFGTVTRQKVWQTAPVNISGTAGGSPRAGDAATLPADVVHAFHALNVAQHRYSMAKAEIESLRMRLYCDWQCWMIARYQRDDRPEGFVIDVNALAEIIRRDSAALNARIARLGVLPQQDQQPAAGTLAHDLWTTKHAADRRLAAAGAADASLAGLSAVQAPGPRFVRPSDPVVAITHPLAQPTRRHGSDGPACLCLSDIVHPRDVSGAADFVAMAVRIRQKVDDEGLEIAISTQGRYSWNPFRLEWEVEVAPLRQSDEAAGLDLSPDIFADSYEMRPEGHDLLSTQEQPRSPRFATLRGRTILTSRAGTALADAVKSYAEGAGDSEAEPLPTLRAAARLAGLLRPQTQSLGGLTDALAGLHGEIQHPIADPLGFFEDKDLTAAVAWALAGFAAPSPRPDEPFAPIRNGWMSIQSLRLVDTFGRAATLTPRRIAAAETFRRSDPDGEAVRWVPLAPRFAQPSRLAVDWVSAIDDDIETYSQSSTPVLGWLTVSHVDRGQVAVHAAGGRPLGRIAGDGRWFPAPGSDDAPASPGEIAQPNLGAIVRWLSSRADGPEFMDAFSRTLEGALDSINPSDLDDHESRALLTGRPIAVVRCRVGIELLGLPLEGRRWSDLIARIAGARPNTRRAEAVRFPVRIGEHARIGDGVLGYWVEEAPAHPGAPPFRDGAFRSVWPDAPGERPDIRPGGEELTLAAGDAPLTLTLLFDPRAALHVSCGVLPTETLRIPPTHYRAQMGRIGFTHLVASALTPSSVLELTLPEVAGGEWSWISRAPDGWHELPAGPRVRRDAVLTAWPQGGGQLLDVLTGLGWLAPEDVGDGFRLRPPATPDAAGSRLDAYGGAATVLTTLERLSVGIRRPTMEPRLDAPSELREGWIRLRPEPATEGEAPDG